jgi:hypothetical protein
VRRVIMGRRIIDCLVIVLLLWFDAACLIQRKTTIRPEKAVGRDFKVLAVKPKSGETITFDKFTPGKIEKDTVLGGFVPRDVIINRSDIKAATLDQRSRYLKLTMKDGTRYEILKYEEQGDNITARVRKA